MDFSPNDVYERFRLAGENWANAEHAAQLLEETRKAVRAQIMTAFGDMSVNKAEMLAEADPGYFEHLQKMVDARRDANKARVNYDAIRAWVELVRSAEASKRAEQLLR